MRREDEVEEKNFRDLENWQGQNRSDSMLVSKIWVDSNQVRIPEQQIIIKDSGQKALVSSIICPICLITLPMPYYECQQCNNSFCPNCIENWWSKSQQNQQKSCIFKCQNRNHSLIIATFKNVKRSNTYIALLEALQFKCTLCASILPLCSYEKHKLKECPETQLQCANLNCNKVLRRKELSDHESKCEYRLEQCQYCKLQYLWSKLSEHQQKKCPQKTIKCGYKQCHQLIKISEYQRHAQNCVFKEIKCPWCEQHFLLSLFNQHGLKCQKRTFQCEWCNQSFSIQNFQSHKCPDAKEVCKLCHQIFLLSELKQHKIQCVFEHMVGIKQENKLLAEENAKLHFKVTELQDLIEDTILNSEGKALEVMKKLKMNERKGLEKDLNRIDYSMASVNKLKNEEMTVHLNKSKFLIFGHGLCIQCKLLESKFDEMLAPLIRQRKEVTKKINELDKFNYTVGQ